MAQLLCVTAPARTAEGAVPMVFRSGPENATVEATVTRAGAPDPLLASFVPFLQKGDRVHIRFPSSEQSPGSAEHRFHALVAYIGLTARFVPAQDHGYSLFRDKKRNDGREIDFTYDPQLGTPVVFLFPEDKQTRDVDGVRDYVLSNPAQFLGSATVAATSDDREVWLHDFMAGLGQGNIGDGQAGQNNVEAVAHTFGVTDDTAIDSCYTEYPGDKTAIGQCVERLVQSANPANVATASNLGAITTSFAPVAASAYMAAFGLLAGIWNQIRRPKQNYEFIPATLKFVPGSASEPPHQEIVPVQPAKWNPPSGVSSAIFFTIGRGSYDSSNDPQPAITDADAAQGALCLSGPRTNFPLKLNRASAYVRSPKLTLYKTGSEVPIKSIPIGADSATAPAVPVAGLAPGAYDADLSASFGFEQMTSPRKVRVVVPGHHAWTPDAPPKIVAGAPRTTIAFTSPFAPCVTSAELDDSSLHSTAASVTHVSADRVALSFDTSKLAPGDATVQINQGSIEDTVRSFAALSYPVVSSPVTVYDGDATILLDGQRLQLIRSLTLKNAEGKTLMVLPREAVVPAYRTDGTTARFVAKSGRIAASDQPAILELSYFDGRRPNEIPVTVTQARPAIGTVTVTASGEPSAIVPTQSGVVYSPGSALITVEGPAGTIYPDKAALRLRKASLAHVYGDAATTATLTTSRQADGRTLQSSLDLGTQLGDALNEKLQIQVYDPQRKIGSDWITLDQRFVPSASIDEIDCAASNGPGQQCEMFGRDLSRIKAVSDGTDTSAPVPCPQPVQGNRSCVLVKDYTKFLVTMFGQSPLPTFAVSDGIVKR